MFLVSHECLLDSEYVQISLSDITYYGVLTPDVSQAVLLTEM
jgi:hypothetical protein